MGGVFQDDMNCAEDYVRFMCQWLLDHCLEDMKFLSKLYDKTAVDRLKMVASTPFVRITYTEAVERLEKVRAFF
jgi:asparaginyl-tRNA synthetase